MTRISILIAALAVGLLGTTAATCQKPTPTNPVVAGVVNCAEAGVHEAAIHIIDDAASALATGDYVAALEDLVRRFGEGALDCAVAEIADTAGKHAAMDELEATKAKRAKAWLASRPVTLSGFCPHCAAHLAGLCPNQCGPADVRAAAARAWEHVAGDVIAGLCLGNCTTGS